ncbi:MAG TPA: hypothetical protein DDZ41_07910 [Flavobacterium sp.]|nr:hypothetical protein [Flavobacterium sp.]
MRLLLFFLTSILFTQAVCGQLSRKHWLPPLHSRDDSTVEDHYLYLSTPEAVPFSVSVKSGDGTPLPGSPFTISKGNPKTILIGYTQPSLMFLTQFDVNLVKSDKGLVLEGTREFYATFKVRSLNHAEILVAKGIPGIGTNFRVGSVPQYYDSFIRNFVTSFMATEDNTTVLVSDYNTDVEFISGFGNITSDSQTFVLNAGESVVLSGYADINANLQGFIGALISSDKPIAVSTGNALGGIEPKQIGGSTQDFNLDQIVSYEQIGSEYIVVRGNGFDGTELPMVVATQNNTDIFVNGSTTPIATINAGDYYLIPSSNYQGSNNQNMYITTSNPAYMYQILAGSSGNSYATSGLNFIPPLSCFFQKSVDLIPSINTIGLNLYNTDIIVLTQKDALVSINGVPTTALPQAVLGNSDWETYRISGFTGNVVISSTKGLAVGIFGTDGNAVGFSGYYSGFGSKPRDTNVAICSSGPANLLDAIDGNPETGGIWTPALASGGDIFNPNIDLPGVYNYTYNGECEIVDVKITVTIENEPSAGTDAVISVCSVDGTIDLFSFLGVNVTPGGSWSFNNSTLPSGSFNPAKDAAGVYTYTVAATVACDEKKATVTVIKNPIPDIVATTNYSTCDTAADGDDTNGFATFDLSTKTAEVLNGQSGIAVSYHETQIDAENNSNPILIYYSNSQPVYVRLTNLATTCYATTSFNLIVNPLPIVPLEVNLKQCDTDTDAITNFNLTFANQLISTENNMYYTYYETLANAQNNTLPIANPTNYSAANNTVVFATATNTNTCSSRVIRVNLLVSTTIPLTTAVLNACDVFRDTNNASNDGFDFFDLNEATNAIISQFPTNQNVQVSYYENQNDAESGLNSIANLSSYRNITTNNQFIWVRIDSPINKECYGLGPYLQLVVNPIPNVDLGTELRICLDPSTGIGSEVINATPSIAGSYIYNWTPSNTILDSSGTQSAFYTVSQPGTYSVEVINTVTLCSAAASVEAVTSSEPVSVNAVLITPLFSNGTASIEALPVGGFGSYEYSIDNGRNWQTSSIFIGLESGSYVILVRDTDGCGIVYSQTIETITFPVFFTPNGDGINDFWNINGLIPLYNAKIYIFDRYGKLIKELLPDEAGWDGTYNGYELPSNDYWFKIEYTENKTRKQFKSHFSLKR